MNIFTHEVPHQLRPEYRKSQLSITTRPAEKLHILLFRWRCSALNTSRLPSWKARTPPKVTHSTILTRRRKGVLHRGSKIPPLNNEGL